MKILLVLICLFCIFLLLRLYLYKYQVKKIIAQVDFLCCRDTQAEITLENVNPEITKLAESINMLLKTYRKTGLQIENSDAIFRETITSLSHDLRTPLATANGYIQLLLEHDLTSEQMEYARIAEERIIAVKKLLDQLFEFARIEADELALKKEPVNLNNALRDTLALYYNDFESKNTSLQITIPNAPFMIRGDLEAITRIYSNILYNALIHGNGDYKISSQKMREQYIITFSNLSNTISLEDISHIFDRFYTTDKSRTTKTTGLGLSIAKRLVEKMDGSITAKLSNNHFIINLTFPVYPI